MTSFEEWWKTDKADHLEFPVNGTELEAWCRYTWDARGKVDAEIVRRFSTCDYDIGAKVAELIERR